MLEEALRNENRNPNETALAMLSFVQFELPAGGTAAEARLCRNLFGPLCDRIFGPVSGPQDGYRHLPGGWLSSQRRWSPAPSTVSSAASPGGAGVSSSAGAHHRGLVRPAQSSWENYPVVKLLATCGRTTPTLEGRRRQHQQEEPPLPTLIEAISNETEIRPGVGFSFPFFALPKRTQEAWMAAIDTALMRGTAPGLPGAGGQLSPQRHHHLQLRADGSPAAAESTTTAPTGAGGFVMTENDKRLFLTLLQKPPLEQRSLLLHRQKEKSKESQQYSRSTPQLIPLGVSGGFQPNAFQLSATKATMSPNKGSGNGNTQTSFGNQQKQQQAEEDPPTAILSMLEYYLFMFLRFPLAKPQPSNASMMPPSGQIPFNETVYVYLLSRYLNHFLPYERDDDRSIAFDRSTPTSELFLRIIISFWIESRCSLISTDAVVQTVLQHRARGGVYDSPTFDLSQSFNLIRLKSSEYHRPPRWVRICLRKMLVHALLDPKVCELVRHRHENSSSSSGSRKNQWCLTNMMTALQQPFYNYIRTTFRYASLHATSLPFQSALVLWLMWLEPWNCRSTYYFLFGFLSELDLFFMYKTN